MNLSKYIRDCINFQLLLLGPHCCSLRRVYNVFAKLSITKEVWKQLTYKTAWGIKIFFILHKIVSDICETWEADDKGVIKETTRSRYRASWID